jgi:hypothetical protein
MKLLYKLIIPAGIVAIIMTMYLFYFSPYKGLGSFNDFDPDSHAMKEIDVKVVHELGIQSSFDGSKILFYTEDKNGVQKQIEFSNVAKTIVEGSEIITMTGHICTTGFEVAKIEVNQ